MQQLE
jgi:hypothetical protein